MNKIVSFSHFSKKLEKEGDSKSVLPEISQRMKLEDSAPLEFLSVGSGFPFDLTPKFLGATSMEIGKKFQGRTSGFYESKSQVR